MLTKELISQSVPELHLQDKVFDVLQMMNENRVSHLPLVEDGRLIGLLQEKEMLQVPDDTIELKDVKEIFPLLYVQEEEHFLKALQIAADAHISIVPVVTNEQEYIGAVTYRDLLKKASEFMNVKEPGGLIVLEIEQGDYSFSEISRLVETNDAQITQLNTFTDPETGLMQVTLKINKVEISDIVATFQRFDYSVKYYFGEELYENELRSNYDNLMNYLDI